MQIRRFHVPNSDQVSHETIMGALDRGHFEPIALPLDERAEGFVNYDNPISQEWHLDEVIMGGQYARFALRIDQKKVDGKAVKVRLSELMVQDREEYKKAAEQLSLNPQHKPKKYRLSRDRKNELKRRAREEQVQSTRTSSGTSRTASSTCSPPRPCSANACPPSWP
jgi:hypothetical protein